VQPGGDVNTEPLTHGIERSRQLDPIGKFIRRVVPPVVRPGWFKDLLSGTWLSHPLHPMLTDVTIGAWTSSALLDVLGGTKARSASDRLVLLGSLSALPTAVTGLSDLADVEDAEERRVGVAHAVGNVGTLAMYLLSYALRRRGKRGAGLALSGLGAAAMTASGFLGAHLAYRRGIGVDRTAFRDRLVNWTAVLDESELPEDRPKRVTSGTTDLFLLRSGDRILALANRCTHRGGPLHKGRVEDGRVTCPWHLSTFSLEDGTVLRGPATAPQPAYQARVEGGRIEVRARPS
jgi:nitrite reductase/ring-hydroxylating ferredoxin subunit/uncharacterized membrane protein